MIRSARVEDIPRLIEVQRLASLIWDAYREQLKAHPEVIDVPAAQVRLGYVRVAADAEDRPSGFPPSFHAPATRSSSSWRTAVAGRPAVR